MKVGVIVDAVHVDETKNEEGDIYLLGSAIGDRRWLRDDCLKSRAFAGMQNQKTILGRGACSISNYFEKNKKHLSA